MSLCSHPRHQLVHIYGWTWQGAPIFSLTPREATCSHPRWQLVNIHQRCTMSQANWTSNRIAYLFEENLRTPKSRQPFEIKGSGGFENGLMFWPDHESTSFTSMGSQVRVLLRPPTRKSLEKSRLFLFALSPLRGCIFPCRQGAILDVNELNKQSVHASRCERVPCVDVNSLPVSMWTTCWFRCERVPCSMWTVCRTGTLPIRYRSQYGVRSGYRV